MRTSNCNCCVCDKPMYRRPFELKQVRYVACMDHRVEAQRRQKLTAKQIASLKLGRTKGDNHLAGIPKSPESNRKRSASHKKWCKENPCLVAARGVKCRGENHYRWNGGISKLNASIRKMTENRKWVEAVKLRDGRCLDCGETDCLEAHHKVSLAEIIEEHGITNREQARDCEQLWDIENGETKCVRCHYKKHGRRYADQ